jgi:hypothetical protein
MTDIWNLLAKNPNRDALLKTIQFCGYWTDGSIMSLLSDSERTQFNNKHHEALLTSKHYQKSIVLDVTKALPRFLGEQIIPSQFLEGKAGGVELTIVDTCQFQLIIPSAGVQLLQKRHPEAVWYVSGGLSANKKPVALLRRDEDLIGGGELLGLIAPVQMEVDPVEGNRLRKLKLGERWSYNKIK